MSKKWKLTLQNPLWSNYWGILTERRIFAHFDYSKSVMKNIKSCGVNLDSDCGDNVFTIIIASCLRHPRPYRIWTGYLKNNIVFCCFYCRSSYTVLLPAYCHHSISNLWNCRPPIHSRLYSLVQSPPKCKVLFWITNSNMPAIIWDWISWRIHASVKDRQCLCCSQLALWS